MTRARATALALVNWKGVFYERYLLDPNVTALEGANGAGKTTVMIAAYVVLMPDMSRLRFTNLGETGATGGDKGIWGRLGEPGSSSYAALEIELHGGVRLVAGVELTRKSEPSVEASPFLITGLNPEYRMQDLLLQRRDGADEVPTRAELSENARALGGALHGYGTAKEYFAALFEQGVSPLRLSTDEDRNKFNEMLRTSMTGGISRALTSELRSFLLREESGLGDTLTRMRGNLDACRRTRVEVSEAQRLEHEIAGVYDVGQSMFSAALLATREEARELGAVVETARSTEARLAEELRALDASSEERTRRHAWLSERLAEKRAELKKSLENQAQLGHARALVVERRALETERQTRDRAELLSRSERERAAAERAQRLAIRDEARKAYERSAQGLADVQKGLDELHRNANRERRAKARLQELRELLGEPDFPVAEIASCSERAAREIERIDAERLRFSRDAELIELRHSEHAAATRALSTIIAHPTSDLGYERAQRELTRLARLDELATRAPALAAALRETEGLAARQASARRRARGLGFEEQHRPTGEVIAGALSAAETELASARDSVSETRLALERANLEQAAAEVELRELEARSAKRSAAYAVLNNVEPHNEPWTWEAAQELCLRLEAEFEELRVSDRQLSAEREAALREAAEFEAQGGSFHPELLRLRDEFDAELLVQRFDDVDPDSAAGLEARLGPLLSALVVTDPGAVAKKLAGRPRELESIWLVAADAQFLEQAEDPAAHDVVVVHGLGSRVTRVPAKPVLGRRARLARAQSLRQEAESIASRLDASERRGRRLEATLRELRPIIADPNLIGGERLVPLREACHERLTRLRDQRRELELAQNRATSKISELEPRIAGLRALLVDAFLLDGRDHAEAYSALTAGIAEGEAARRELDRVGEARQTLEATMQALRCAPGSKDALAALAERGAELDLERDRWFKIGEALAEIRELVGCFESNAEQRAAESVALVPALEEQYAAANRALAESERILEEAEGVREQATLAWQQVEAERAALVAQCARLDTELARVGVSDYATFDLRSHDHALAELSAEADACDREEREISMNLGLLAERRRELGRECDAAFRAIKAAEQQAQPSQQSWQTLRDSVTGGALPSLSTAALLEAPAPRASAELWADARSKCELLLDRLGTAHGGAEQVAALKNLLGEDARSARGDAYLKAWLLVREWLGNRVPTQVADVQDPLEALERLRDQLFGLERRLSRQESDLRGASEDIARSIEVQLRRAGSQVRRLNQSLESIRFGSIQGIRVRAERVERMAQVLRALREGDTQELLFQPTLPIEDALNEVFRRYAGGRSGGHRILDYREYVELSVEILRQGSDTWELANPTRLSTGEAIGVGAALMMVVLSEWERDANLLRGKREHGSLRFLFLDEANRLSPDNLGVLFDLCQSLELQLLIAAPEVARADGNTTYRLVRTIGDDGREEVIVSGRRAAMPERVSGTSPETPTEVAVQGAFRFES
ncbi:MAG TPA: chromosome partition protein MukB [Polyangiaceae bacterium]|nr:chromosome partition protein MukB [Polyangiaceae bacterium]